MFIAIVFTAHAHGPWWRTALAPVGAAARAKLLRPVPQAGRPSACRTVCLSSAKVASSGWALVFTV